jgi:hypothetical protein
MGRRYELALCFSREARSGSDCHIWVSWCNRYVTPLYIAHTILLFVRLASSFGCEAAEAAFLRSVISGWNNATGIHLSRPHR